ncbi:hypothetical protein KJ762_10485 [bacterium]|nr:hypothetical protein [bacterium]MBU1634921.1 hypothetical protein [bacterium]MBU1872604.1 hypothetical protein [bacterium]
MKQINKRQYILLAIFLILVIYLLFDRGVFSGDKSGSEKQVSVYDPSVEMSGLHDFKKYTNVAVIAELEWNGKWKIDPFFYAPPESSKTKGGLIDHLFGAVDELKSARLKLTGISWHGNSGYALINGSIVREDDKIGGYKVKKIAHNYVILIQGENIKRLEISE